MVTATLVSLSLELPTPPGSPIYIIGIHELTTCVIISGNGTAGRATHSARVPFAPGDMRTESIPTGRPHPQPRQGR